MSLVKLDPFRLTSNLNRLLSHPFASFPFDLDEGLSPNTWLPPVDIYDTEEEVIIKAELPGIDRKDISIDVKDNTLTLRGTRHLESEVKEEHYYRRERSAGSFSRVFSLPARIDPEKIKAKLEEGVLVVEVPKPEETKSRQVSIL